MGMVRVDQRKIKFASVLHKVSYKKLLHLILQKPGIVIAAVALATLFFSWQIPKIPFSTSIQDLVIEDLKEAKQYALFKSTFGSSEIIRIVVTCDNVFHPESFNRIGTLSQQASRIHGVRRVVSLWEIKNDIDISGKWSLDAFARMVDDAPLFNRNLISDNHRTTALTLVLGENANAPKVIQDVKQLIDAYPKKVTLYQIGMPLISNALANFTQRDFIHLPPITFILIAAVLFLFLKGSGYFYLPLLSVSLALLWTLGLMALMGYALSILTMIVPVFLIAVGTAYCLHILWEYIHCRRLCKTRYLAVEKAYSMITFPTILAMMTTVVGLGSLVAGRITAIKEFSVVACLGMFSILIILLTFLPAMLVFMPEPKPQKNSSPTLDNLFKKTLKIITRLNLKYQPACLTVILLFVVFCIFGLFQLKVETNPVDYFKKDTAVSRHFHDIYKDLSGSFPLYLVMNTGEEDYFLKPENIAAMEKLQQFLQSLDGVDKSIAFSDYIKLVRFAANRFEKKYYQLPKKRYEMSMLLNSYKTMLGKDMLTPFVDETFSKGSILMLTHISNSGRFLEIRDQILSHVQANFSKDIRWDVTGFGMVVSASSHHLTSGQIKSLALTISIVFLIMFMLFLSLKVGLITIIPNLFPIVVNFGIMGWLGIELSMATSLIAGIAIGLAVDDTIHYLTRYNREFRKDLDEKRALEQTIMHIGRPIIITTITISIGFSVLWFSSFKPTAVFGLMMAVTMVSALVGDLILLPSLILHTNLVTLWDLVRLKMGMAPRDGIPLFKGLSKTQIHYIIMAASLKKMSPGELLFEKGEASDTMYAVISGNFEVIDHQNSYNQGESSDTHKVISHIGAGDIVGELGLLRSAPRSATVLAVNRGELLPINWRMIRRLQWLYPPAAFKFHLNLLNIISDRLDKMTCRLYSDSVVDDLTGLCNKRGFLQLLENETRRAIRYGEPFMLCLIKVDNDAGNPRLLLDFSRKLSCEIRGCDTLGRIDSNIFALLAVRSSEKEADFLCTRCKKMAGENNSTCDLFSIKTVAGSSTRMVAEDTTGEMMLDRLQKELDNG